MPYRWTPELQEKIAQYVRAGGFVWVAAEAAGLPRRVLQAWMQRGARSQRQPYRGFHDAIMEARAQSRLKAEMETRTRSPRDWLRLGPGRERPGFPGWTHPAKADTSTPRDRGTVDLVELSEILRCLLRFHELTPETRMRLAEHLNRKARKPGRTSSWQ
jgi:hypothetical protein